MIHIEEESTVGKINAKGSTAPTLPVGGTAGGFEPGSFLLPVFMLECPVFVRITRDDERRVDQPNHRPADGTEKTRARQK